jgi:hypothetical protein
MYVVLLLQRAASIVQNQSYETVQGSEQVEFRWNFSGILLAARWSPRSSGKHGLQRSSI